MTRLPVIAIAALTLGLVATALPGLPFRELIIGASLLTAPGLAIATLAGIRDPLVLALVTVPVSIAVSSLVATTLVYGGAWSTELVYASVAVITLSAAWLGTHERGARVALLGVATLPAILLVVAQLSRGAP